MRLEGSGKLKKIHLIGTRTRDLPACSIVPTNESTSRNYLLSRSECISYGGRNVERDWFGLEPVHLTTELSLQEEFGRSLGGTERATTARPDTDLVQCQFTLCPIPAQLNKNTTEGLHPPALFDE
jgi:hypothetical protein